MNMECVSVGNINAGEGDENELVANKKHNIYSSSEDSILFSDKIINLPSKSETVLSNFKNDFIDKSISRCGILNNTAENILSLLNLMKSVSFVTNTLFSDFENSANLPLVNPFGLEITSTPCSLRNLSSLLSTFSSKRNLTCGVDIDDDIFITFGDICSVLQSCCDMFFSQGRESFEDFINICSCLEHFKNLPDHNSSVFESRFTMADFRVNNYIIINFYSHNYRDGGEIFKCFSLKLVNKTRLASGYTIAGVVVDNTGAAVSGAVVYVLNQDNNTLTINLTTNSTGGFSTIVYEAGNYAKVHYKNSTLQCGVSTLDIQKSQNRTQGLFDTISGFDPANTGRSGDVVSHVVVGVWIGFVNIMNKYVIGNIVGLVGIMGEEIIQGSNYVKVHCENSTLQCGVSTLSIQKPQNKPHLLRCGKTQGLFDVINVKNPLTKVLAVFGFQENSIRILWTSESRINWIRQVLSTSKVQAFSRLNTKGLWSLNAGMGVFGKVLQDNIINLVGIMGELVGKGLGEGMDVYMEDVGGLDVGGLDVGWLVLGDVVDGLDVGWLVLGEVVDE